MKLFALLLFSILLSEIRSEKCTFFGIAIRNIILIFQLNLFSIILYNFCITVKPGLRFRVRTVSSSVIAPFLCYKYIFQTLLLLLIVLKFQQQNIRQTFKI